MKQLCKRQWVERYTPFDDLCELWKRLIYCLEKIDKNNDAENKFDPNSFNEEAKMELKTTKKICFYFTGAKI